MHMHIKRFVQTITTGVIAVSMLASAAPALATSWVSLNAGDLIKLPDDGNPSTTLDTAVYYYAVDGTRYVFPNDKTYFTWYSGFNNVKEVTMEQLGTITIGGNATYRPGVKMIKIESDPKVYAIDQGGARRHVTSEAVAIAMYGSNWNKMIDDVPDSFFSNYPEGQSIVDAQDFQPSAVTTSNATISIDKNLYAPVVVIVNTDGGFTPNAITLARNKTIRFNNNTGAIMRVKSDLPGFDSAYIPAGLNYVYRFKNAGSWTFYNHDHQSMTGTVTIQ